MTRVTQKSLPPVRPMGRTGGRSPLRSTPEMLRTALVMEMLKQLVGDPAERRADQPADEHRGADGDADDGPNVVTWESPVH